MNIGNNIITPKISIILPIYNAGNYLRPCLDTLINQTLQEIEIVCILDCPTDGSDKIVDEYAKKDSRLLVIKNDRNLHVGESRNVGIQAAHGEYIGFSDHDDIRELNMYEKLYAASLNGQADVVLSGKFVIETDIQDNNNSLIYSCLKNILNRESTAHITPHIFKKDLIEKEGLRLIDTKQYPGEDIVFFLDFLCRLDSCKQISLVPEIFYHHIETGHNTADTSAYSSLQKIPLLVHHVHRIIQESQYSNYLNNELWTFMIITTYTPFIKTVRNEGIFKTVRELKNAVIKDDLYCQLANDNPKSDRKLTIAKRIFSAWLKHTLKTTDSKRI